MKTKQVTELKVFNFIREHHMLEPGDRVVAGISGGADSVCLLLVLLEYAKQVPLELAVVHVNHGIRKEAAADAAFVEALCREQEIPFYLIEEDVRRRAAEEKCSEEDAGRRVRYEAFLQVAEEWGADKIAVAHNSNDRCETMLFHLFRGSGLRGLGSIQPVRDNIIRPVLCLERAEIEQYLQTREIAYCLDATNATDDYTRNRIRHHVIPYVEQEIVQGCVAHMTQTAELLSETEDYLEQQTQAALKQCVEKSCGDTHSVIISLLLEQHITIQKRVLHHLVKSLAPGQRDISYVHIRDLWDLFTGEGNRMVCLPFGIRGRREYERVYIERKGQEPTEKQDFKEFPKAVMEMKIMTAEEFLSEKTGSSQGNLLQIVKEVPQNEYTKWFDYDKIKGYTAVRYRRTGDYLTISDGKGNIIRKSLKDYMISQKIPQRQRDSLLLLAEENHVIWLPGYRISEYYKIGGNTKRILQVQLVGEERAKSGTEENNGRTC